MKDGDKTKEQLINELVKLRQKLSELEESEKKYAHIKRDLQSRDKYLLKIQEMASVGNWEWDVNTNHVTWSDEVYRIIGLEPRTVEPDFDLYMKSIYQANKEYVYKIINETLLQKKSFEMEYRLLRQDGAVRYIHGKGEPVIGEDGNILKIVGFVQDTTELNQAKVALMEGVEFYQSILDGIINGVWVTDNNDVIFYVNKGMASIAGVGTDQIKNVHVLTEFPETTLKFFRPHYLKAKETLDPVFYDSVPVVTPARRESYQSGWLIPRVKSNKFNGMICTVEDITERKRAQEALKESERYLAKAQEITHIGHWKLNPETNEVIGSDELYRIFGLNREESMFESFVEVVHPEDREFDVATIRRGIEYGENWNIEHRLICRDGTQKWIQAIGEAITDETGKTVQLVGTVQDITKRKQAEEEILFKNTLLEAQSEASIDGILVVNSEGKSILFNKRFVKMWYMPQQLLDAKDDEKMLQYALTQLKKPNEFLEKIDYLYAHRDEKSRDEIEFIDGKVFDRYSSPLVDSNGRYYGRIWYFRDITERKEAEKERLKSQKIESLGVLAGGIAHDFNNLLTGIIGNISLTKDSMKPEDMFYQRLVQAEEASLRAGDLTQQLLTFSKGGAPIKKATSIGGLIEDSVEFALRGSNVRCDFSIVDDLWPVEADKGQINQVINNIIINADQAMSEGGVIKVYCENIAVGEEDTFPIEKGKYIKIEIRDQGAGIPKEHLQKIFDPYFTTKEMGSGLGLATSYSIIKRHGGLITVESEISTGTIFCIYLPASEKKVLEKKESEKLLLTGEGRVLVMDDEAIVRDVAVEMLKHLGYEAEFARDGEEAIESYEREKASGTPFDVVIMDSTIAGGMGGKETIKKLLEIDPDVKAIVSSGYSNDPIMSDFGRHGFSGVVAKPYRLIDLSETVHRVIKGES